MPTTKPPYPAEFRQQIVELVQAGRTPAQLAREFKVSAQSISIWVARAATDRGKPIRGKDVLSSAEREELARLRRENRQLKLERDILAKRPAFHWRQTHAAGHEQARRCVLAHAVDPWRQIGDLSRRPAGRYQKLAAEADRTP